MTQPLRKALLKFLKKLKIKLPHDLAFQFRKYSEIRTRVQRFISEIPLGNNPKAARGGVKKKDQTKALNQADHSPRQGAQSCWGAAGDSKSTSLSCPIS